MKKFNKNLIAAVFVFSLVLALSLPNALLADDNLTAVNLGSARSFTILSKTGISTTGTTSIVGDIGVSPAAASYITGFGLNLSAGGPFSTSAVVSGKVYAPDYANPAPANLTSAVLDMQTAYTDAAGRASNVTELGAGNIGGMTLVPGVYKWSTGLTIPTDVTLSGSASDVWIFQVAQNLNVSSGVKINLSGGAQAGNIFWVVAGQTTLGTTSVFNGNILDQTAIVLNTGASLNGRALAQTAVTLDSSTVMAATVTASTTPLLSSVPLNACVPPAPPTGCTYQIINSATCNYTLNCTTSVYTPLSNNPSPMQTPASTNMQGCTSATGFSTVTGQACASLVPSVIPGCNGSSLFSTSTGQLCVGNAGGVTAQTAYNFGTVTLKNGSSGTAVMELQRFLNRFLALGLVVDGKLGPKTIAVIKKWQKDNGLVADGLIGVKTKAMMNSQAGN